MKFPTPILILILSGIIYSSCKKENDYPKGSSQAELNNIIWNAERVYATPSRFGVDNLIDFYITKDPMGELSQELSFGNIEKNYEQQRLFQKIGNVDTPEIAWSSFLTSQDYDVSGDDYTLLESDSANNWLQITSAEDNFTKNIEGTFSATYYRTKTYQGSLNPDTIRLRNGTFYISKLKE